MENRILEEQEKKFRQLTAILANIPRPDNKSGFFAVRCGIPEALQSSWSILHFFDCIHYSSRLQWFDLADSGVEINISDLTQ
jgi:hypothetical protein